MRTIMSAALLLLSLASAALPVAARTPGELPTPLSSLDDAALAADVATRLEALAAAAVPPGADLAVLFERRAMELSMQGLVTRYDGAVVLLPGHAAGLEYRVPLPFEAEVGETAAWVRRADGAVVRLPEPLHEAAPLSGSPVLVLADPDAAPGDVVGWSASFTSEPFSMRVIHPSRMHFVLESVVRLITPEQVHYGMMIRNPSPGDGVSPVGSALGQDYDQLARFTELAPLDGGPFARPDVLRPALMLTGMGNYAEPMARWFLMDSWEPLAGLIAGMADAFATDAPVAASVARQAVADDDSDRVKLLKLQRLASRQLATIPEDDFAAPAEPADAALARKAATPRLKTMVLYAMARALDLDVDLVLARDNRLGPLNDAMPSLAQFTDVLVSLAGDPPLFLAADDRYPAGTLPAHLHGAPAVAAVPGAADIVQKTMMKMALSNAAAPDWGDAPPLRRFYLPGDPAAPRYRLTEALTWEDGGRATARLESVGESGLFLDYRAKTPPAELLAAHLAAAYPARAFTPGKVAAGKPKSSEESMHVVVRGPVSGDAGVPAPAGDVWTLPAEAVFGAPTAAEWEAGGPFHVDGERTLVRSWSHPLPDGWRDVQPVETPRLGTGEMDYSAVVSAAGGVLKVTRTVTYRPCDLPAADTGRLAAALARVRAFETSPLELRKR